jgi:hypothetical protein
MGFMDKVKAQAEVAVAKAQQGVAQGQSKLDDYQGKKAADALLLTLGHAFYAEQRTGGSRDEVVAALAAVDQHVAENGAIVTPAAAAAAQAPVYDAGTPAAPAAPAAPASSPAPGAPAAGGGSFSLDDL